MITYQEAIHNVDKENWIKAINEEKQSLSKNNTCTFVNRDQVQENKILSSRWVFKIKEDGKYKARLVIRGGEQKHGIDYDETFSPVVSMNSLRIFLALAAKNNFIFKKFDVKTAFLYSKLEEQIFMEVPEGYNVKNKVCLLQKSLYGLKLAPLKWNECFTSFLKDRGLSKLKSEHCIFKNKISILFLAIYVDDGILVGQNSEEIEKLLKELQTKFEIVIFSNPSSFLGIEIKNTNNSLILSQTNYIKSILENFDFENLRPVTTPMEYNSKPEEKLSTNKNFPYREIVGSLLYLSSKTRPDIAYSVNVCSRKLENPTIQDIANVKRILRYLISSKNEGICYNKEETPIELYAYSDSDFAGDIETRKSTTGYIIMFCGGPIAWCSRKQPIVSLSSTEAEYIAAAECTKEIMYLKSVIEELTNSDLTVNLKVDNQSAIKLVKNGQFNRKSEHIDVRYHYINEKVSEGLIKIEYCATNNQIADILTKPLNNTKFQNFKSEIMCKI